MKNNKQIKTKQHATFINHYKLKQQFMIQSDGSSWIEWDYSFLRFNFKNKDWRNHLIWKSK